MSGAGLSQRASGPAKFAIFDDNIHRNRCYGSVFAREKRMVKRPAFRGRILAPVIKTLLLITAAYALFAVGATYWRSYNRSMDHARPVHADTSRFSLTTSSGLAPGEMEIILRGLDGAVTRVAVDKEETEAFLRQSSIALEAERISIYRSIEQDVTNLFESAFADRDLAVNAYADWFFEWKRSYIVLKDTMLSTVNRAIELGRYEGLREAVENDVRDYFLRHYRQQVLKPDYRDPVIARGMELIARNAHERYLHALTIIDVNMSTFVREKGRSLDSTTQNGQISELSLDWDAQKWKAPTYLMEDRAFAGITGLGAAGAGGIVGSALLRSIIDRALARATASLTTRFAGQAASQALLTGEGAAAGTVVAPGAGTVVGAAIGIFAGFGIDYAASKADEAINRETFVEANQAALDATIAAWRSTLTSSLQGAANNWFNDAKTALVMSQMRQKQRF